MPEQNELIKLTLPELTMEEIMAVIGDQTILIQRFKTLAAQLGKENSELRKIVESINTNKDPFPRRIPHAKEPDQDPKT